MELERLTLRRCFRTFSFCASCVIWGSACAKVMLVLDKSTSGGSTFGEVMAMAMATEGSGVCVCGCVCVCVCGCCVWRGDPGGPDPDPADRSEGFESSWRKRFITCSDTPPPEISACIWVAGSSGAEGRTAGAGAGAGTVVGDGDGGRGTRGTGTSEAEAATTRCHSVLLPSCSSNLERSALFWVYYSVPTTPQGQHVFR